MGIINNGVRQWLFQRISNALFVTFGVFLCCIFLNNDGFTYSFIQSQLVTWKWYFAIVLIFACLNAVLAAWQIDGDYAAKFGIPHLLLTLIALIVSIVYLIYGLKVLLF